MGETLKKRSIIKNQNRVSDGIFRGVGVIGSGCEVRKRKKRPFATTFWGLGGLRGGFMVGV